MSVSHTYRLEWTDESRATLYIDRIEEAECTTNVPQVTMRPFTELIQSSDGASGPIRVAVSDDLFKDFL